MSWEARDIIQIAQIMATGVISLTAMYVTSRQNQMLKELDFQHSHAKMLIDKRFKVYAEFEAMAFEIMQRSIDASDRKEILSCLISKESFSEANKKVNSITSDAVWLDEYLTELWAQIYEIFTEISKQALVLNAQEFISLNKELSPGLRKLSYALLRGIQHSYWTLHQDTRQLTSRLNHSPVGNSSQSRIWQFLNKPLKFPGRKSLGQTKGSL